MTNDWQKVKEIFNSALEHDPGHRSDFVAQACEGDSSLRNEVEKLLADYRSDFLEKPLMLREPDTGPLAFGECVGRYRIVRRLGAGGMGEVYVAEDESLDRKVAVKVLHSNFSRNDSNVQRFIREAKAASALNHPNILVIHEIGESRGARYIVSELVEGKTLREVLNHGRPPLSESLDIAAQTAEALAAAHAAGIIHRDIKPENLMVRPDGYVKVLDFGLAKLLPKPLVGPDDQTVPQNATVKGTILGTVSYMSPEQARGEDVDGRSDIFSLGVVLYEMVAGETPFAGDSTTDKLANLINKEPVPLSQANAGVPEELERIVGGILRKDRGHRYQSMNDLIIDLKNLARKIGNGGDSVVTPSLSNRETEVLHPATADGNRRTARPVAAGRLGSPKKWVGVGVLLLLLLLASAGLKWYMSATQTIRYIAVLPLENLSGDASQEYFADGMTEALINNLSQIKELKVISRTSIMRYKGNRPALPEIAKALGVDAIVEGSVQRSGNRVRVTAQLIHAASDTHVWAQNYERDLSDVLKLQSDVARAVAQEIRVQLTPAEQTKLASSRSIDPKAHEAYLLGKFHMSKTGDEHRARSIAYFQQAIALEHDYADAYAGLASAWLRQGIFGDLSLADFETRVREAATEAIRIDPDNANAHVAMCALLNNYRHDWSGAEVEAKRALEIDPNNVEALVGYSWLLQSLGRHAEVRPLMETAEQLDPVSSDIQSAFGRMLYRARKYDEAERHLKRSIELDPTNLISYSRLTDVYIEMGRFDDALAVYEKEQNLSREPDPSWLAFFYARKGERKKALDSMTRISDRRVWGMARLYAALGENDKAFEVLNEAAETRDRLLVHLKEEPNFVSLHPDPRWKALLRQLKFPEE